MTEFIEPGVIEDPVELTGLTEPVDWIVALTGSQFVLTGVLEPMEAEVIELMALIEPLAEFCELVEDHVG